MLRQKCRIDKSADLLKKSDESALAEMQYHPTINAD
jgi:hypothetical protein